MIIPNDIGGEWRLNKFVEYQHYVPPVQYEIFKNYAKIKKLTPNDQIYLSWIMCNTYQEVTSLLILEEIPLQEHLGEVFNSWYKLNKERVILGGSKKHMAYKERLEQTFYSFEEVFGINPISTIETLLEGIEDPLKRTEILKEKAKSIKHIGRFAADYFIETIHLLQKEGLNNLNLGEELTLDYVDGSNLTSALFNLNNMDDLADRYDRGEMSDKEVLSYKELFDDTLDRIDDRIFEIYKKRTERTFFVTKLCSFRNLFKNSRYGGFHHDRQLGYLNRYLKTYPEKKDLFYLIFSIRKESFRENLLGELNNWDDVRKDRKRLWTEYGFTGVEEESKSVSFKGKKKATASCGCLFDF